MLRWLVKYSKIRILKCYIVYNKYWQNTRLNYKIVKIGGTGMRKEDGEGVSPSTGGKNGYQKMLRWLLKHSKNPYFVRPFCIWILTKHISNYNIVNKAIRDGKYLARHMPVLGNVHPIKIEKFDIFSWRHFSVRSSCYINNWYGYPRGSHAKYLKEIVSLVFEIRHWIVTC